MNCKHSINKFNKWEMISKNWMNTIYRKYNHLKLNQYQSYKEIEITHLLYYMMFTINKKRNFPEHQELDMNKFKKWERS